MWYDLEPGKKRWPRGVLATQETRGVASRTPGLEARSGYAHARLSFCIHHQIISIVCFSNSSTWIHSLKYKIAFSSHPCVMKAISTTLKCSRTHGPYKKRVSSDHQTHKQTQQTDKQTRATTKQIIQWYATKSNYFHISWNIVLGKKSFSKSFN